MNYNIANLPEEYRQATDDELKSRIAAKKREYGDRLLILTHHYQRIEIVAFNDFLGDSYTLAKEASRQKNAEHIIFCGVRFMAEAADILTAPNQNVYLANPTAGCPMADMAAMDDVSESWQYIESALGKDKVIPISYMNSSAELKAFTGKNGGLICTSSNAAGAFDYCLNRGKKPFFFPDQHLGRNTANSKGIAKDQIVMYDHKMENGGLSVADIRRARVILWSGYCHVHTNFTPEHIRKIRREYPEAKIVVHPECIEDVANMADSVGSTAHIVKFVEQAPAGSIIAIGTEINLVHRLAVGNPDKTIISLAKDYCTICSSMFRTSLNDLCFTIENLDKAELVKVPEEVARDARLALQRMLEIGH